MFDSTLLAYAVLLVSVASLIYSLSGEWRTGARPQPTCARWHPSPSRWQTRLRSF